MLVPVRVGHRMFDFDDERGAGFCFHTLSCTVVLRLLQYLSRSLLFLFLSVCMILPDVDYSSYFFFLFFLSSFSFFDGVGLYDDLISLFFYSGEDEDG